MGWGGREGAKGVPLFPTAWKHPGAIETHGHLLHFNNGFPSSGPALCPPPSSQTPFHGRLHPLRSAYVQHGCPTLLHGSQSIYRELYGTHRTVVRRSNQRLTIPRVWTTVLFAAAGPNTATCRHNAAKRAILCLPEKSFHGGGGNKGPACIREGGSCASKGGLGT